MNGKLQKIFALRKSIKEVTQIIRKDYPDYTKWATEIDRDIEELFTNYLDEPISENYDAFGRHWFSTEPIIRQIMEGNAKRLL
jgi:hypothetical protein